MGKRFKCNFVIDDLQPNRGWWCLPCDTCSSKTYEEGSTYGCGNEKCSNKSVGPRLGLLVVASGDRASASVEMVFFGDLARDLVGKPDDLLVVDHYGLISTVPKETTALGATLSIFLCLGIVSTVRISPSRLSNFTLKAV